jgi:enoyl-CoA hydratase/carnithine racemase
MENGTGARALEVLLSAEDYDAELAERYGCINRTLPANTLGDFVRSLAHRIASFPAAGHVAGDTAGRLISKGSASSFTVASPCQTRARMARRVESARAERMADSAQAPS